MALALSPDGETILTGSWDKDRAALGRRHRHVHRPSLSPTKDRVWAVAFSPDGKTILTAGDDKRARLFPTVPELPEETRTDRRPGRRS